jgi:hypothetical protein
MSKSETKKHEEDHGEVDAASDLSATPGEARSSLSGKMKRKEYEREMRVSRVSWWRCRSGSRPCA